MDIKLIGIIVRANDSRAQKRIESQEAPWSWKEEPRYDKVPNVKIRGNGEKRDGEKRASARASRSKL